MEHDSPIHPYNVCDTHGNRDFLDITVNPVSESQVLTFVFKTSASNSLEEASIGTVPLCSATCLSVNKATEFRLPACIL